MLLETLRVSDLLLRLRRPLRVKTFNYDKVYRAFVKRNTGSRICNIMVNVKINKNEKDSKNVAYVLIFKDFRMFVCEFF